VPRQLAAAAARELPALRGHLPRAPAHAHHAAHVHGGVEVHNQVPVRGLQADIRDERDAAVVRRDRERHGRV